MLLGEYPFRQGLQGIVLLNRHGRLDDDGARIGPLIDEVRGAARYLNPVVEGLLLAVDPGKRGQKGRMDVDDAVPERADKMRAEDAHVPRRDYEIGPGLFKKADDGLLMVHFTGIGLRVREMGPHAEAAGGFQGQGVLFVGHQYPQAGVDIAPPDPFRHGGEVGSPARGQERYHLLFIAYPSR